MVIWNLYIKVVKAVMGWILNYFCIKWTKKQWDDFVRFAGFCLIGVSNAAVFYLVNIVVLKMFEKSDFQLDFIIANFFGFVVSVLWSFYWNAKLVFNDKEYSKPLGIRILYAYVSYSFTGIILNNVLSAIWIFLFAVPKVITPLMNILFTTPVNYICNKHLTFKTK